MQFALQAAVAVVHLLLTQAAVVLVHFLLVGLMQPILAPLALVALA
jgi:hypothetical protein